MAHNSSVICRRALKISSSKCSRRKFISLAHWGKFQEFRCVVAFLNMCAWTCVCSCMNCFLKLIGDTSGGLTSDLKQASMNGAEYNYIYIYICAYVYWGNHQTWSCNALCQSWWLKIQYRERPPASLVAHPIVSSLVPPSYSNPKTDAMQRPGNMFNKYHRSTWCPLS